MAKVNWKKVLKSKTLWINFAAGLVPIALTQLEMAREYITPVNFVIYTSVLTFVNFVVRFITSQPLLMKKVAEDDSDS